MGKVKKEKNSKSFQGKANEAEGNRKRQSFEKARCSVEEGTRKYGYISADSVVSMAESAGFSGIQDDVARNLAEDVTYRLRYIIQQCKKYMIHSKRKKLCSADVNEVLRMCDAPAIYGYAADGPLHEFIYVKEADVFILDDEVIDLPSFALNDASVLRNPPLSVLGTWLRLEDKTNRTRPETKSKNAEAKVTNANVPTGGENLKVSGKNLSRCENPRLGSGNEENETKKIPTNLIKYYGITCNAILGHSDLRIIFRDLSNNGRIIPIVPYLLNFIAIALNKLSGERQLQRLLQTVEALSKNKNIDFTPYSATARVINAVLLIVASDKKSAGTSHDFQLKHYGARVLSLALRQWCSRDEQRQTIVRKMANLLCDFKASPKIHYGALALLTALGPEALHAGAWKTLKQHLGYLERLKELVPDHRTGNDRAMLEEIILTAAASLYRSRSMMHEVLLRDLDDHLRSYFGDAICNLRPNALGNPRPWDRSDGEYARTSETKPSRTFRRIDRRRRPPVEKLFVENVFALPKARKRKSTRIIFKFAGAIPVPEANLKRRRFPPRHSHIVGAKESEGRVLAGKRSRIAPKKFNPYFCLFSVL